MMDRNDIKKLTRARKILLVQDIWDDIEKESIKLSSAIKDELDQRIELHKTGKATYISLEESRLRNAALRNEL